MKVKEVEENLRQSSKEATVLIYLNGSAHSIMEVYESEAQIKDKEGKVQAKEPVVLLITETIEEIKIL